jgi:hypothetical protein
LNEGGHFRSWQARTGQFGRQGIADIARLHQVYPKFCRLGNVSNSQMLMVDTVPVSKPIPVMTISTPIARSMSPHPERTSQFELRLQAT